MPNPGKQVIILEALRESVQDYKISDGGRGGRDHRCSHWWLLLRQEVRQGYKGAVEQSDIGRKEAVPLPGPTGGGSLSSWKEPDAKKKKEDGEPGDLSSADQVPTKLKLKEPEDNKNLKLSSADDKGN